MKKGYIAGLLSGLAGTMLLFSAIFMFYSCDLISEPKNNNSGGQVGAQETKNEDSEEKYYSEIVDKLAFLESLVKKFYLDEVDQEAIKEGIYKGFMASLKDPYSTYYTAKEYKALLESSSGVYHGIGATVTQDVKTGIITIVKPFETGPAYRAGILPGDIIYKVDGEEVTGMDLSEVVSRMKGLEGTNVKVTILRDGVDDPIELTIKRQQIKVPTIEFKMLPNKIGYILISEFDEITVSQFNDALRQLEAEGMRALVVDVRNNPGGLLDSVVKILDRLLPKGLIVYTEDKYGKRTEEGAVDDQKIEIPLAVLINGNSASASEIFAGAVQDYKIGTVVGMTSFGKGIVQKVIPLTDGTAIKLTISTYFTPKGRNIHGTGIIPDYEVELDEELKKMVSIPQDKDNQLQEAIKILMEQLK